MVLYLGWFWILVVVDLGGFVPWLVLVVLDHGWFGSWWL